MEEKTQLEENVISMILSWNSHSVIAKELWINKRNVSKIRNKFWMWLTNPIYGKELWIEKLDSNVQVNESYSWQYWDLQSVKNSRIKTLDELLSYCKVDLTVWEVDTYSVNKWEIWAKDNDWKIITEPLYSVKARIKRIKNEDVTMNDAFNRLLQWVKWFELTTSPWQNEWWVMFEINLFDLHIDKRDFLNQQDVVAKINKCIARLYNDIDLYKWRIEQFVLPLWNDLWNTDWVTNSTTAWTPQEVSMSWRNGFEFGCQIATQIINQLSTIAKVIVPIVPWNHDTAKCYYLWEYLKAYYRNVDTITIDNNHSNRKYVEFGNCGLWYTHWDKENKNNLPLIMLRETWWCNKKYLAWHLWHLHKWSKMQTLTYDENIGIEIEHLRWFTWTDTWHHEKWYVCTTQAISAFVWDKEYGKVCKFEYSA